MSGRVTVLAAALAAALGASPVPPPAAHAAENIGFTTVVKNQVISWLPGGGGGGGGPAGAERALGRGDQIFQSETIATGEASQAQLLFRDETVLTLGSAAQVVLDRFVYDPAKGSGEIVLDTAKGAFRFISGSAASETYKIKTPAGTMGIRGTIVEWAYDGGTLVVILREGGTEICIAAGVCRVMDRPGTYLVTDGDKFSGIRKYKGKGGEVLVEGAEVDLLMMFLGAQRTVPVPVGLGTSGPTLPPPAPPPVTSDGFAPLLTGAGTAPAGLTKQFEAGSPPPGLVNNRDPDTFLPPGLQKQQ